MLWLKKIVIQIENSRTVVVTGPKAVAALLPPLSPMANAHIFFLQSRFLPSPSRCIWFLDEPQLNRMPPSFQCLKRQHKGRCLAMAGDLLGDFGARDPFPEELESRFGEKVLGCPDTEHRILIPNLSALSLAELSSDPKNPCLPEDDSRKLLRKVVGWRLVEENGVLRLQCLWKLRDYKCGVELINRISNVVEAAGHYPCLHLDQSNHVTAELWTQSLGGLSMNDFIVAAKIDLIKTSDLIPKKRVWA